MNSNVVAVASSAIYDLPVQSQMLNASYYFDHFLRFIDVSPKSERTYRYALIQFFNYLKKQAIITPSHEDIVNYKKDMQTRMLSAATISLYLAAVRRFFAWLEQEGIYKNVALGVKGIKQDTGHKRDFLSAPMIKNALECIHNKKRDYAIFSLAACCGLRTIEISRANIEDLSTLGDTEVLYVQGKGRSSKSDFVKLPQPVRSAIKEYLNIRGDVNPLEPLFVSSSNRNFNGRLTTRTISSICKKAMIAAGYNNPRLTAHSLRHSAVTLALMGGLSLQDVSAFARHHSVAVTQIYSHEVDRLKSQCENTIASQIFK